MFIPLIRAGCFQSFGQTWCYGQGALWCSAVVVIQLLYIFRASHGSRDAFHHACASLGGNRVSGLSSLGCGFEGVLG